MNDWLTERLERYHTEIAAKNGRKLIVGPVHVAVHREGNHSAVRIDVGACEIVVAATPAGRRVFITIDDGSADVQIARRHRNGQWT